jgi:hypothetical protein
MAQAYYVSVNGTPTPRSDLTQEQRDAVQQLLQEKYPQHACI